VSGTRAESVPVECKSGETIAAEFPEEVAPQAWTAWRPSQAGAAPS